MEQQAVYELLPSCQSADSLSDRRTNSCVFDSSARARGGKCGIFDCLRVATRTDSLLCTLCLFAVRFSDKDDPEQTFLSTAYGDAELIETLSLYFAGQTVTVGQIDEYVAETPFIEFKAALKKMEEQDLITVVEPNPKRKKGTFADLDMRIKFT